MNITNCPGNGFRMKIICLGLTFILINIPCAGWHAAGNIPKTSCKIGRALWDDSNWK